MFARLGKFLKRIVGNVLYWIGWALAIFVITQAIILSVTSGNPLIPLLLGGIGVTVLLIAIRLKKNSGRTVITALEAVSEDIITVCGEDCSLR